MCKQCGVEYESIGSHWSHSSICSHPELTDYQKSVTTGVLMGDGTINKSVGNPRLVCTNNIREYLEFLDSVVFPVVGNGVRIMRTAEEGAKHNRDRGFRPNAKAEDYSDHYRWLCMRSPEFKVFSEWYSADGKVWPEDIDLNPVSLKHLYVCDGNLSPHGNIRISMVNERENKDKVEKYFEDIGFGVHSWVDYDNVCYAKFSIGKSEDMLEYMGDPIPGYEYKWDN